MSETTKMLVLSTAHITNYACNEFLPDYRHAYEKGDYGWFVLVPTDDNPVTDDDDLPCCLIDCLKRADASGCGWVMFDRDGPVEPSLQEFDW